MTKTTKEIMDKYHKYPLIKGVWFSQSDLVQLRQELKELIIINWGVYNLNRDLLIKDFNILFAKYGVELENGVVDGNQKIVRTVRDKKSIIEGSIPSNPNKCPKCNGVGSYMYDKNHGQPCEICCKHNQGSWLLEKHYGKDNGKWCCKKGCGYTSKEKY